MIEQELLFLGLLKAGPKHGYRIKKEIKEILSLFAGLDLKSIYYPLRILEKKGLLVKRASKPGNRPARFTYALTDKGEFRFQELLKQSFLNFKRPQFSLDLSLYFLSFVKPEIAQRRLRGRMFVLRKLGQDLERTVVHLKKQNSSSLARILEHNLEMVEAEMHFLKKLTTCRK
jgi:DNA-binding PadR family transcriptional regulator